MGRAHGPNKWSIIKNNSQLCSSFGRPIWKGSNASWALIVPSGNESSNGKSAASIGKPSTGRLSIGSWPEGKPLQPDSPGPAFVRRSGAFAESARTRQRRHGASSPCGGRHWFWMVPAIGRGVQNFQAWAAWPSVCFFWSQWGNEVLRTKTCLWVGILLRSGEKRLSVSRRTSRFPSLRSRWRLGLQAFCPCYVFDISFGVIDW